MKRVICWVKGHDPVRAAFWMYSHWQQGLPTAYKFPNGLMCSRCKKMLALRTENDHAR